MSIVRVIYRPDKSVVVIHPALKSKRSDETEDEWLERVFNKGMQCDLKGLPYDDVDSSELPQEREDRDAWTGKKGKGVSIDEVKAAKLQANKEVKAKIAKKIRDIAIDQLKAEGELPSDYQEKES